MNAQEIRSLIEQKIAGQGTNVDARGALPSILNAILDLIPSPVPIIDLGTLTHGIHAISADLQEQLKWQCVAVKINDSVLVRNDALIMNDNVINVLNAEDFSDRFASYGSIATSDITTGTFIKSDSVTVLVVGEQQMFYIEL